MGDMMAKLFGTSGIRGRFWTFLTPSMAFKIGHIFSEKNKVFYVASDNRPFSNMVRSCVIEGARSKGACVRDCGVVPTPVLAFSTQKHKTRGIMVTASHNPWYDNGLKLYENGSEIPRETERDVEKLFEDDIAIPTDPSSLGTVERWNAFSCYKKNAKPDATIGNIHVVIDPCGAVQDMAALLLPTHVKTTTINQGSVFQRAGEPEGEVLDTVENVVKATGANLGVVFDTDGDRCRVVDEIGTALTKDEQLAIAVDYLCQNIPPEKKPIYIGTVEESSLIKTIVEKHGVKHITVPVGSRVVCETMRKTNAFFGAEPCGEYVFSDGVMTPDGLRTMLLFCEIATTTPLSKYKQRFPTMHVVRGKVQTKDKDKTMERAHELKAEIESVEEVLDTMTIDGIRWNLTRGFVLIRKSGTEPVVRITVEHKDKKTAHAIYELCHTALSHHTTCQK